MNTHSTFLLVACACFSFFLIACGDSRVKDIEILYDKVLETDKDEEQITRLNEYLFQLMYLEQDQQKKSPKSLHQDLLSKGRVLANEMLHKYPRLEEDIDVKLSQATISGLLASYNFLVKSDIIKAAEYAQEAVDIFDSLVNRHPNNAVVRGYRFINYSYFPDILEKSQYLKGDFAVVQNYIQDQAFFTDTEMVVFQEALDRVLSYESEHKEIIISEDEVVQLKEKIVIPNKEESTP